MKWAARMKRYDTVPTAGALGARLSEESYDSFQKSSLPNLMLALNLVGAVAHGTGILITRTQARMNIELPIWHNLLVNTGNTSHPVWTRDEYVVHINPVDVITAFFGLSFGFHIIVSLFLVARIYMPESWYTQWYMWGLYYNMAPWRWLEYFFSAPLMLLIAAPMMGIREIHSIWATVGTLAVTILFGWITELHGAYLIEQAPEPYEFCGWKLTRRWKPGSWKTRWQIHMLGYVPYALCWGIVFDRFRLNMEAVSEIVPDFVNLSVILSFILFTFFGLTQFLHQFLTYGPSVYWLGEVIYVTLSFAAKAQLGFVILVQALLPGALFDNVLQFKIED